MTCADVLTQVLVQADAMFPCWSDIKFFVAAFPNLYSPTMASQHIFKRNHAFDLCSKIHKIFTRFDLCRKLTPSWTGDGFCFFLAIFFFKIENISFKIENISMNYLNRFVSLHHGRAAPFVFRSTIFAGLKTFVNLKKLAARYRRIYSTLSQFL